MTIWSIMVGRLSWANGSAPGQPTVQTHQPASRRHRFVMRVSGGRTSCFQAARSVSTYPGAIEVAVIPLADCSTLRVSSRI